MEIASLRKRNMWGQSAKTNGVINIKKDVGEEAIFLNRLKHREFNCQNSWVRSV